MPLFQESSNLVANGLFIDRSVNINVHNEGHKHRKGTGIDALRKASLPEAIHDSGARDPPRCFPGTREEHIRSITGWGLKGWKGPQPRVLWLQGPAGVGKSAVAQTCAESIGDRLGAAFFFSRSNQWNKSTKFLPTIIYQLAKKHAAYRDLVDAEILHDPLVLEKSIEVQFRELLVGPLRELRSRGHGTGEDNLIIVDGLDECDDQDAQRIIIEVVVTSVHQQTTPFLWAFFSRPEPHITAAFESERASKVCWQLTLPVSRDADRDIEAYLRDAFRMIRAKYKFPPTFVWPSEEEIHQLVHQSSGLFIYPASAIRYIASGPGALGPEAKLRSVLALGKPDGKLSDVGALSNLDRFYMHIMEQIPKDILPNTLLLLFARIHTYTLRNDLLLINCSILGISLATFYAAISNLHSVLEVQLSNGLPSRLSFYHASFPDFLCDVERSTTEFCVETADIYNRFYSKCVDALCRLSDINDVNEQASILAWPGSKQVSKSTYMIAVRHIFCLSESPLVRPEAGVLHRLSGLNWRLAAERYQDWVMPASWAKAFFDRVASHLSQDGTTDNVRQIPKEWRPKIIRLLHRSPLYVTRRAISGVKQGRFGEGFKVKGYIIGSGSNKVLLVPDGEDLYRFLVP